MVRPRAAIRASVIAVCTLATLGSRLARCAVRLVIMGSIECAPIAERHLDQREAATAARRAIIVAIVPDAAGVALMFQDHAQQIHRRVPVRHQIMSQGNIGLTPAWLT